MPRINLLPWREALRKKRQKDFVTHAGLALIGAASIALLAHMTVQGQIEHQIERNTYLEGVVADLDKKIEEIQSLKKKRDDLVARMGAIEKLQSTRSLIVKLFEELARTTPEGIVLTNVSMGEGASAAGDCASAPPPSRISTPSATGRSAAGRGAWRERRREEESGGTCTAE